MPEIILKNVAKRFGKFVAVDNLNLNIPSNSFITLLGPSGCGKTTTLRMIAGLETPTEGSISIDGKVVFDADQGINLLIIIVVLLVNFIVNKLTGASIDKGVGG